MEANIPVIHRKTNDFIRQSEKSNQAKWYTWSGICRSVRKVLGRQTKEQLLIANQFVQHIDSMEKVPPAGNGQVEHLTLANDLLAQLATSSSQKVRHVVDQLKVKKVALAYRTGQTQKTEDELGNVKDSQVYKTLTHQCKAFKARTFSIEETELTEEDERRLAHAVRYTDFAELLGENKILREAFFKWTIRDGGSVKVFVQFPTMQERISQTALSPRIGYFNRRGKKPLKVEVIDGNKQLNLAYQTDDGSKKSVNLLQSENQLEFNDTFSLTVDEMFQSFQEKKKDIAGRIEFFEDGVTHWNTDFLARTSGEGLQTIDLESENWMDQLPIFETLSAEAAKAKFGEFLDGNNWAVCALSSRQSDEMDFAGNHAYLKIVAPDGEGGYTVYPFGKFPKHFPESSIEMLQFLSGTTNGRISYLDPNVYYTHRKHVGVSFELNHDEADHLKNEIRQDLLNTQNGGDESDFVFQLQWSNCAKWVQDKVKSAVHSINPEREMPNLYRVHIKECQPDNFLGGLFKFVRALPKSWQNPVIRRLDSLMGAGKGISVKGEKVSLKTVDFWQLCELYHPIYIAKQVMGGELNQSYPRGQ